MFRRLALLVLLLGSPATARAGVELGWLPTDTASVTGAPGARVPFLAALERTFEGPGKRKPACWTKLATAAESSYQVWRAPPDRAAALVVRGRVDRAAVEACLSQSFRVLKARVRLTRQGPLTELVKDATNASWLGWSAGWLVWHPQRARVEELLAALEKGPARPAPLAEPLRRVNPATELWIASTVDYTGRLLGVPSRSMVGWLARGEGGLVMPVAFEFKSPADAERAARALEARRQDPALPAVLRTALASTKVTRQLHFLTFDLDPAVWMTPETMEAVGALIGEK